MISPGLNRYEVVLQNRFFLRELIESITLEESLDEIAYRATIGLVATDDLPDMKPGQEIRVSGIPFGDKEWAYLLHPGVVWECTHSQRDVSRVDITAYDRTIYLAKSEDEYLLPAGQTASQRLNRYAADWNVSLAAVPDTEVLLSKAVYRAQPIYRMIMADLKETAMKGGGLYRVRMTPNGLELLQLGSNQNVWRLESERNLVEASRTRTLEGTVTQVKVLGLQTKESDAPLPVVAIEKGDIETYGTLQKVMQMEKEQSVSSAIHAARHLLGGFKETVAVSAIDINTMRAGDKAIVDGTELLVTSIRHELGVPGRMSLELASESEVRRQYYDE